MRLCSVDRPMSASYSGQVMESTGPRAHSIPTRGTRLSAVPWLYGSNPPPLGVTGTNR
jgi:hypothetical protein